MTDTTFTDSYFTTDALLEAAIGVDPRTAAIALKAASASTQQWYCQRATLAIDNMNFSGLKLLSSQARQFPRKYIISPNSIYPWGIETFLIDAWGYGYDSTSVPADVLTACMEEAIALYDYYSDTSKQRRESLQDQGVKSFSLGDLSESFGSGSNTINYGGLKSKEASGLLEKYIENAPLIL